MEIARKHWERLLQDEQDIGWAGYRRCYEVQWTEWVERCEYDWKVGYVSLSEESESSSSCSTIVISDLELILGLLCFSSSDCD